MATYSTKYNIGDRVFVFQPSKGYSNPTLTKTTVKGIETKAFESGVSVYYRLLLMDDSVPQCNVYASIDEALHDVRIEEYTGR